MDVHISIQIATWMCIRPIEDVFIHLDCNMDVHMSIGVQHGWACSEERLLWLQIAHVLGAKVVAVARGSDKARALKELGADDVIDTAAVGDKALRASIKVGRWMCACACACARACRGGGGDGEAFCIHPPSTVALIA